MTRSRPPRYASACNLEVGLLFTAPHDRLLHVHSALTLQSAQHNHAYERLHDEPLILLPEAEEGA
jgi:hypothetical protein